jgi:flagellar hook-associated protein 1 FlgK
MSLSGVLHTARFALDSAAAQTAVVSRNIAGASDPNHVRKLIDPGVNAAGGADTRVVRAQSPSHFARATDARSEAAAATAMQEGLDRMRSLLGGDGAPASAPARIDALRNALRTSTIDASDPVLAGRAIEAAGALAETIRTQALGLASIRDETETKLSAKAEALNGSLAAFQSLNTRIVSGSRSGTDVTDLMDQRDVLVRQMSENVGIRITNRADNDMMLQTDSGVMLFETRARSVSFEAASPLQSGRPGGRFLIDGVVVAGPGAVMPISSGSVRGLSDLRDGAALTQEAQLDETARLLVSAFRETDVSGSGKPDKAGLFVIDAAATIPPDGMRVEGLARRLSIAAGVDPAKGGDVARLRDGAINGDADYRVNTGGGANFTGRLQALTVSLDAPAATDPAAKLGSNRSASEFAVRARGWLEETRKDATAKAEYLAVISRRTEESLASATGVSLDAEMTHLLELERSYGASAKLITVVDQMFASLLNAVR